MTLLHGPGNSEQASCSCPRGCCFLCACRSADTVLITSAQRILCASQLFLPSLALVTLPRVQLLCPPYSCIVSDLIVRIAEGRQTINLFKNIMGQVAKLATKEKRHFSLALRLVQGFFNRVLRCTMYLIKCAAALSGCSPHDQGSRSSSKQLQQRPGLIGLTETSEGRDCTGKFPNTGPPPLWLGFSLPTLCLCFPEGWPCVPVAAPGSHSTSLAAPAEKEHLFLSSSNR